MFRILSFFYSKRLIWLKMCNKNKLFPWWPKQYPAKKASLAPTKSTIVFAALTTSWALLCRRRKTPQKKLSVWAYSFGKPWTRSLPAFWSLWQCDCCQLRSCREHQSTVVWTGIEMYIFQLQTKQNKTESNGVYIDQISVFPTNTGKTTQQTLVPAPKPLSSLTRISIGHSSCLYL